MAAFETPWMSSMSSTKSQANSSVSDGQDPNPPTIAPFSPSRVSANRQRSTILVQQKSPLLIATPPQITRALAFSHPFLLPLNKLVGLLSWSSGDPWESFLLVGSFWIVVLYGDVLTRWSGPLVVVVGLILGMYSRRYSPLSSTGWTGEKTKGHKKQESESRMRHQKSLEEIVDTLNTFTSRCNLLLEPLLQLTDFLSTQRTATSATTRPALTSLFLRILMITPIWIALSLPPIGILTSRRVVLATGTTILSWHSRPARISRTLLWRSMMIRRLLSVITGMDFYTIARPPDEGQPRPPLPPRKSQKDVASSFASTSKNASPGVRFTFVVYENQRRWLGLGWTSSMFAYERAAWTDEHLNASASKDEFQLPVVDNNHAKWQWAEGQDWQVEGAGRASPEKQGKGASEGWIFYDNKWNDGRRDQDGWGRYTRRRKWYRDAELVEATPESIKADDASNTNTTTTTPLSAKAAKGNSSASSTVRSHASSGSSTTKRGFLTRRGSKTSGRSSTYSGKLSSNGDEMDAPLVKAPPERHGDWSIGDDIHMSLG